MDSISLSRKDMEHTTFVADAYHSFLGNDAENVMTFTLEDNCIVKNVNSSMFRVFSPLISSILREFPDSSPDFILPDFKEDCFRHLIEVLTFGHTKVSGSSSGKDLKCLAQCLDIQMDSLCSNVKISQISQTFLDSEIPNIHDARNEPNNNEQNVAVLGQKSLEFKNTFLQETVNSLSTIVEDLQQEKDKYQVDIEKLKSENIQLKRIGKTLRSQFQAEEAKVKQIGEERIKLLHEMDKLKKANEQLKKIELTVRDIENEKKNLVDVTDDLRTQLEQAKQNLELVSGEKKELAEQLNSLIKELEHGKLEFEKLKEENSFGKDFKTQLVEEVSSLKTEMKQLEEKLDCQTKETEKWKKTSDTVTEKSLENEKNHLVKIILKDKEIESLKEQIEVAGKHNSKMKEEIDTLKMKNVEVLKLHSEEMDKRKKAEAEVEIEKKTIDEFEFKNNELKVRNEQLKSFLKTNDKTLRSKFQAEEKKVKDLEKELKRVQEEKTKLEESFNVSKVEDQLQNFKRKNESLTEKELKKVREEKSKLEESFNVSKVEDQLQDLKKKNESLIEKFHYFQQKSISVLENAKERMIKDQEEKRAAIAAIIQEDNLSKEIDTLQKELNDAGAGE